MMDFIWTGLGIVTVVSLAVVLVLLLDRFVVHREFYEAANEHERWFVRTGQEQQAWLLRLQADPSLIDEYFAWTDRNRAESEVLLAIMGMKR